MGERGREKRTKKRREKEETNWKEGKKALAAGIDLDCNQSGSNSDRTKLITIQSLIAYALY